jgi:ABC-type transport system involved in cytochrome c biogenesis ATPase subunit
MEPGVWIKDTSASDLEAYGRSLDVMGLGGLQKTTALRLIEGLEIVQEGSTLSVRFLTVVPFFKVDA